MKELKLKDIQFQSYYSISSVEYKQNPSECDALAEENMRQSLAQHIIKLKAITDVGKCSYTKRLEVFIATPEEFWYLVNREAEKLSRRYKIY